MLALLSFVLFKDILALPISEGVIDQLVHDVTFSTSTVYMKKTSSHFTVKLAIVNMSCLVRLSKSRLLKVFQARVVFFKV